MLPPPRYGPDRPLPPYAFVPGQSPHPFSDPRGHRYGEDLPQPGPLDPNDWPASLHYLLGVDLFNHGYPWEAHEMWERVWHACGRRGDTADFLKGLIKLAAAGVKHRAGKPAGVQSHARRAAELWRRVSASLGPGQESFLGLRLAELIGAAERIEQLGWPAAPLVLRPTR